MNRRITFLIKLLLLFAIAFIGSYKTLELSSGDPVATGPVETVPTPAGQVLGTLEIKGRAPKTGYSRAQFGNGWERTIDCDVRNDILARDLTDVTRGADCTVLSGILQDPYSGKPLPFTRGPETSDDIQIDHVVALSDAWQKGAQQLAFQQRIQFANDPLGLLAVDGALNQKKGDGDAATWLPPNKAFRCQYVARQIAVKKKYSLWVTRSEYNAMAGILKSCPDQTIPR